MHTATPSEVLRISYMLSHIIPVFFHDITHNHTISPIVLNCEGFFTFLSSPAGWKPHLNETVCTITDTIA